MPTVSHGPGQTESEREQDARRKATLESRVRKRFGEAASIGEGVETVHGRRFDLRGDFDVSLQTVKELENAMGAGCRVLLQKIRGSDGYKMSVEIPKTFRKRLTSCEWVFLLVSLVVMFVVGGMIMWEGM